MDIWFNYVCLDANIDVYNTISNNRLFNKELRN